MPILSVASRVGRGVAAAVWTGKSRGQRIAHGVLGLGVVVAAASGLVWDVLNAVPGLRSLPGVSAVLPIDPPVYERSIFGLRAPLSVALSESGEFLYVAEGAGDRFVRKIRVADGESVGELAPPRTDVGTRKPMAVAVSAEFVYVVDRIRRTVDVYDASDQWLGALPSPKGDDAWQPLSVDVDEDGRAYVTNTDAGAPALVVYDRSRHILEEWGSIEADGVPLSFPNGVARGSDGRVLISDGNNARLVVYEPESQATASYGNLATETLALPRGIAFDSRGILLVADANDHSISGWDVSRSGRNRVFVVGEPGIGDGAFLFPTDLVIGRGNRVYVADRDNDRVQIWRY